MTSITCVWDARAELGEGVRYDAASDTIWWVDILGQRIFSVELTSGARREWPTPETVGCVFLDDAGEVHALLRRSIARLDRATGEFHSEVVFESEPTNNRFNDGAVGPDGSLWVASMDFDCKAPTGRLYLVSPAGATEVKDEGYVVANGPAFSPDGTKLYINETMLGLIYRFEHDPATKAIGGKKVFARIAPEDGLPDGLCVDADGGVWVALVTGGRVRRYLPDGSVDSEIAMPTPIVTSLVLGGQDSRTLFVTTGRILMEQEALEAHPQSGGLFRLSVGHSACRPQTFAATFAKGAATG